ncbi:chalcone synthase [Tanacetum coccineum]
MVSSSDIVETRTTQSAHRKKSMIIKRHTLLSEEFLKENPTICDPIIPFLDLRQDLLVMEVLKLGKEAAIKAIKEWGQPKSSFHARGTVPRLAKDLDENNKGARVLAFADRAGAVIVGFDSDLTNEVPLFKIVSASQTILPNSEGTIGGRLSESSLKLHLSRTEHSNVTVLFIIDEMRKKLPADSLATIGEGLDWGVLFRFGPPGLTVETLVLHSFPTTIPSMIAT